eukprot:2410008-Prymnesium_polylepis.1
MAPAALACLVASKRFTSKKGDLPMVIELNTCTIISLFRDVNELSYANLGWGNAAGSTGIVTRVDRDRNVSPKPVLESSG